jgi:hypothetical protein
MKEEAQETLLKLDKSQLEAVLTEHIGREEGLNEVFNMVLNGLMYVERQTFLKSEESSGNKGNGYRESQRSYWLKAILAYSQRPFRCISARYIRSVGSSGRTSQRPLF